MSLCVLEYIHKRNGGRTSCFREYLLFITLVEKEWIAMTLLKKLGWAPTVFAVACLSSIARAESLVPVGFLSYDVTGMNVAEFDITNLTGPNSLPPDFPVTNSISMSSLLVTVYFAGNVSQTYGPSYFTLGSDGLSFNGDQLSTLSGPPTGLLGATTATLTGDFAETTLDIGGLGYNVSPAFSVLLQIPVVFFRTATSPRSVRRLFRSHKHECLVRSS